MKEQKQKEESKGEKIFRIVMFFIYFLFGIFLLIIFFIDKFKPAIESTSYIGGYLFVVWLLFKSARDFVPEKKEDKK